MSQLAHLVGAALSGVVIGFVLARWKPHPGTEPDETPIRAFACEGCGERFPAEIDALRHAINEHRAPDIENAQFIIEEVST